MTQLYTVDQAAEVLAIHPQAVRRLVWGSQLAWVDIGTGRRPRIRISVSEIERFIKSRTQQTRKGVTAGRAA